ncbi:MAG: ATP-binding cassette domain-containing protein [Rhodospirillales bacterium]
MIRVENLQKSFKAVRALDGLSFEAPDGAVTGLIGPNGAGKTTALRILCTVMRPDSGRATIDGLDTAMERQAAQQRLGVVPDSRGLYPRMTAREHILYCGRLHGMDDVDLARRIDELTSLLGMAEFIDRRAKGFSKGQMRKVALARALVHRPQNILLDEPTNGLDVSSSRSVHDLIRELRDQGRCIVFCSHIMQEVANISDQVVVMARGRAAACGTVPELLAQTGATDIEGVFLSLTGDGVKEAAQ